MSNVPCTLPAEKKKHDLDCVGCIYEESIEKTGCYLFKNFKDCKFKRFKPFKRGVV